MTAWLVGLSVVVALQAITIVTLITMANNNTAAIKLLNEAQGATTSSINSLNEGMGHVATFMERATLKDKMLAWGDDS